MAWMLSAFSVDMSYFTFSRAVEALQLHVFFCVVLFHKVLLENEMYLKLQSSMFYILITVSQQSMKVNLNPLYTIGFANTKIIAAA